MTTIVDRSDSCLKTERLCIHIYGASGSGTTTLANYLGDQLGFHVLDTDDYYWMPTNPPYTTKRPPQERVELIREDIYRFGNVVISGSLSGWGDSLIPTFTLAIRLVTETKIRLNRIRIRESEHFGDRIKPGGDMYQIHTDFMDWAAAYDTGDKNMRSKAKHDEWEKKLGCMQIRLDGSDELAINFEKLKPYIRS